jgi:uncharacterized protein (TIGR02996 family)
VRRFELDAKFWELDAPRYGMARLRWGTKGGHVNQRELRGAAGTLDDQIQQLIAERLAEGYVEVFEQLAVVPVPHWWGRFERGAAYLEIGLNDCTVRQRRGDTLEDLGDTARKYDTREEAREMVERVTRSALATGFTLVREGEPPMREASVYPELEEQCLANPDDPSAWAIYADWLLGRDDVRGELAALQLGGKQRDVELMLHQHREELFGVNADSWLKTLELTWRHGFVRGARIHSTGTLLLDDLVRELLALPIARLIDTLHAEGHDATIDAIVASAQAPWIRELKLGGSNNLSAAWAKLPALEVLRLDYGPELGEVVHPRLRQLVYSAYRTGPDVIERITRAQLPKLQALELGLGESSETPLVAMRALLASTSFPELRHLGLTQCAYLDALAPIVAVAPIVQQLRTLDLSDGLGTRAAANALVAARTSLGHLERIDLAGNMFAPQQQAQLAKALPNAVIGIQKTRAEPSRRAVRLSGPAQPIRRPKR